MIVLPKITVKIDGVYHKALEPFEIDYIPPSLEGYLVIEAEVEENEVQMEAPNSTKKQSRKKGAKKPKKEESVEELIDTIEEDSYLGSLL